MRSTLTSISGAVVGLVGSHKILSLISSLPLLDLLKNRNIVAWQGCGCWNL